MLLKQNIIKILVVIIVLVGFVIIIFLITNNKLHTGIDSIDNYLCSLHNSTNELPNDADIFSFEILRGNKCDNMGWTVAKDKDRLWIKPGGDCPYTELKLTNGYLYTGKIYSSSEEQLKVYDPCREILNNLETMAKVQELIPCCPIEGMEDHCCE